MKNKLSSGLQSSAGTHSDIYENGGTIHFNCPIEFLPNYIQYFPEADVGFDDASYFAKIYKTHTGITPSEYRKNLRLEDV